jgi:dipeptidyl aminopeptidase/acylaminoacyl peptidase
LKSLPIAAALFALAFPLAANAAPPSMAQVLEATYAGQFLGGVDLSPDGSTVVWNQAFRSGTGSQARQASAVYESAVAGGVPTLITAGCTAGQACTEGNPVWSPDGKWIAFLSDAQSKPQGQVFVADAAGKNVRQVGKFSGTVQSIAWSPSGKYISALYIPDAHREAGALAAGARDVGVIGSVVDEQRLTLVDVASGALRMISPANDYVYEYGWSPDSTHVAVTYAPGNGDNNWWIAHLATIDTTSGQLHDLLAPAYQMNSPRWSPDGKRIAFIGGVMSDFGSVGGDVYVIDAGGADAVARDVTPNMAASAASLRWNDASSLDMVAHVSGAMHVMRVDADNGTLSTLVGNPESIFSWSSAKQGAVLAMSRQSFDDPANIWAGPPNALVAVTKLNADIPRFYGKAVSLTWKNEGFTVQGWLVYPLDFDPSRKYPMITVVHGGPSAESLPTYANRNISALASQGYFVFMPNPRGSFGQGEAFTKANVKDFGYGDWRDDLAGVDAAIAAAPIDPSRLGLFGWSYGGYIAMWAETQTTRFKAIVAGAGVVSWQSYYGQNKIDEWMIPFFGASVYDDPAVYAKSSPIMFIKNSKTPVLTLQGERDEEVPAPQAFEFYQAMQTLGVPSQLVVYADEGHAPQRIVNQIDILTRMVGWFGKYLTASPT